MNAPLSSLPPDFGATVASLHRVAEQIVAPARKPDNEISLRAVPGGFGTPEFEHGGEAHQVVVEGVELVHRAGDAVRRAPLSTLAEAAGAVAGLLPPGAEPGSEPLAVDPEAARARANYGFAPGDELSYAELLAAPDPQAAVDQFFTTRFELLKTKEAK